MIDHEPDPLRRIPTKHTAHIRAEIGAILRAARLQRGLSLEDVASQTRISKRFLEAMENDRFDEFAAIVYLRGFLKGYCDHLGVDFSEQWSKIETTSAPQEAAADVAAATVSNAGTPARAHAPAAHAPTDAKRSESSPGPMLILLLAFALAVGLGIRLAGDRKPADSAVMATTPRVLMPMPRTVDPRVVLRTEEDAWVQALVDGASVFAGRMPRGAVMEWKPSRAVSLRSTAPEALRLTVNGSPADLPTPTPGGEYLIDIP
ncbi:MAG: hypothetical protein A2X40_06405 [Elusimicrobia bacterium GWC2_65_9]|nr:MAG: hypothetical protein A2X37_08900 [Elusimicrobia bacterium GWA2_66_18]OGR72890.1 MAG: hypothetical protein A2X40_06405 [Elusimicrobia bacterium GWC2_65_9]